MRTTLLRFSLATAFLAIGVLVGLRSWSSASTIESAQAPAQAVAQAQMSAWSSSQATSNRVFEIRTYHTHDGKLDDLDRRFRDHTRRLFEKHGMTNVGYWIPQDPELSQNTLIYLLAYPTREAADRSWAEFRADPEWQEARAASEAGGPLVQRVESVFLDATDYSPLR